MHDIRIGKVIARYHPPAAERHRLDQVMKSALDDSFERALAEAGAPTGGEFCIRRLRVPVRLRTASADAALAAEWQRALAAELARAMRDGRAVVYASRRQALLEMAVDVARGTLTRAWAWRQLGLWQAEIPDEREPIFDHAEAMRELLRALCDEPAAIAPLLGALAEAGVTARLCAQMTGEQWPTLARAALAEIGLTFPPAEAVGAPPVRAVREAWRVLNTSRLLRGALAADSLSGQPATVYHAAATLAVLETEPALLPTERAPWLIALVADAVRTARFDSPNTDARQSDAALSDVVPSDVAPCAGSSRRTSKAQNDPPAKPEAPKDIHARRQAQTQFGGLLFLLGLLEEAGLVDEILAHDALGLRPLRWTLHALALALVPAGIADAAALAFAGLPPDTAPPVAVQAPMSETEAAALQSLAARVIERLRALLDWPEEATADLIEFVCRRQAEILADPGWIEVRLPLDEVSTEIRRAGLDLDPGYLPWLGVVVRFVYA